MATGNCCSDSKNKLQGNGHTRLSRITMAGLLVTIGIVFGDIGTSPLYVMKAIAGVNHNFDADYIIGAVSCVIWTLVLQTTVKYVCIALKADNKGEGGILALYSLLRKGSKKWLYIVAALGASALIADGVITPAITVTSAIEGLRYLTPEIPVVPIVIVIILIIFLIQQKGTGSIGRLFGPVMLLWFLLLGFTGVYALNDYWPIFKAFNPYYAVKLLVRSPEWFLILGAVFLCTTGAEALYSDLGHCGKRNITVSWMFVKLMLILNYLGQGAWMISHHDAALVGNPLFSFMPSWLRLFGVILSTFAAIIASQALLSGSFTIFSEAFNLDFWPRLRIKYPSKEKGQLYIPMVNWALLAGCLITVLLFRDSSRMEAAYGLAITVTMLMTTVLLTVYLRMKGVSKLLCGVFMAVFMTIETVFFVANVFKFMHGGWYTLLIAALIVFVMIIWYRSTQVRDSFIEYKDSADSIRLVAELKEDVAIPPFASNIVYFSRSGSSEKLESKLVYSIINKHPKRADHYWIIHIEHVDSPDTLEYDVKELLAGSVFFVTMRIGYRVDMKVTVYLRQIVEDLVKDKRLDLVSTYPSLRKHGIPGDFRFIVIHRVFSASNQCNGFTNFIMSLHEKLRKLGISDTEAMGLDTSSVMHETVPLIINYNHPRRISKTDGND